MTVEVRTVPEAERLLEVIIEEVAIDPATLEVKVLPVTTNELGTDRLVNVALVPTRSVMVALVELKLVEVVLVATMLARLAVPVAVMFVPVALSNSKLEIYEEIADKKLVKKFPELTMFSEVVVPVRFKPFRVEILVVAVTPFTVVVRVLEAPESETVLELMIPAEVVETMPLTTEVQR